MLSMKLDEAREKLMLRMHSGREIRDKLAQTPNVNLHNAYYEFKIWDDYNNTLLQKMFQTREVQDEYNPELQHIAWDDRPNISESGRFFEQFDVRILRLNSIYNRLELYDFDNELKDANYNASLNKFDPKKVFIVHGRDIAARETVARFIENIDLKPVILHEQPDKGKTLIEKFETNSNDIGFAIVLLTPDDLGGINQVKPSLKDRARQNVILELGYFFGKLGRSRVCTLHKGSVELPSDFSGIVYVPFDDLGGWKLNLAKELNAAGYNVDTSKLI
jgi:predicted nucleotide-binding protein